jgi:hypothetical protein
VTKHSATSSQTLADDFVHAIRSMPSNDERHVWAMHELCGLDRSVSMQLVGCVGDGQLSELQAADLDTSSIGWPNTLEEVDLEQAKLYGFDPHAAVEQVGEGDFAEFGIPNEGYDDFKAAFVGLYPALGEVKASVESFVAYYAHAHTDYNEDCRAQLILVLENDAGHRLFSIDQAGEHHLIAPRAGDVIFLDNRCSHAVFPDQSQGVDHMRANPMKAVFLLISDSQPGQFDNCDRHMANRSAAISAVDSLQNYAC